MSNSATANRMPLPQEFRHVSTGSLNIPPGGLNGANGAPHIAPSSRFDGPRSPPGKQNTAHVPCKFFRQGACQAGTSCPFSHDLASTVDNVCKYFAKGNCKFGPKCANIHVLPDGRRVNYKGGPIVGNGGGHLNIGGRVNPEAYHAQNSALTNSLFRATAAAPQPFGQTYSSFATQDDGFPPVTGRQASIDITVPLIDTSYASHSGSNYGSPRDEDSNRFGLGLSPVASKGLSVLDAPLPSSFDSNGISYYARQGPIASSVPTKFGIESPPSSIGAARDGRTSEALKNLHSSAFGDDTRDRFNGIPSSPPSEEYFGKRAMHSQRFAAKTKAMSASLPKAVDQDWEAAFTFEEDYLPETLKDLMTPQEKARRGSRNADEERPSHSGTGTPNNESASKFGSPSNASPSRWGPLFQRHQQQKEEEDKAAASRASAFGHVGSPLRNSSLHPGATPTSRPTARTSNSGDSSPFLASPPRQSSMSIISQQLQRTRLQRAEPSVSESGLHPVAATRISSTPVGSANRAGLVGERQISSSSIGNGGSGRFTTPIDEEQGDFVFNMEGMEDDEKREKRNSGGWTYAGGTSSPHLGPIGASRNGVSGTSNDGGLDGIIFGGR